MPIAESFIVRHDNLITAVGVVVAAFVLVAVIRAVARRQSRRLAPAGPGTGLSQAALTRIAFLRRAIEALVILVAIAIALSQFQALHQIGRALLTSGAIAAAVIGFAARQTLAGAIAGIMLAITQPLRIGDEVTIAEHAGVVEEVGLFYTWLRRTDGTLALLPNELVAGAVIENRTLHAHASATGEGSADRS